jgi:thymidylate synthase
MNKLDKDYQALLQDILDNGIEKTDRTGTGIISVFGRQIRHNMRDGFPLLTTKKMAFKTMVTELLWFLRGDTNIKYLVDNNCHIWDGDAYKRYVKWVETPENQNNNEIVKIPISKEDFIETIKGNDEILKKMGKRYCDEFAKTWGELGPIYGKQWRKWKQKDILEWGYKEGEIEIDQIQNLINDLKTNPDSRRLVVNAWNVGELDQMVLPPCHYGFQVYTRELSLEERIRMYALKEGQTYEEFVMNWDTDEQWLEDLLDTNIPTRAISLMWNQRSVDTFLGLPFNIASYGLLLEIIAKAVNMIPDELIGNLGDVHLYSNHIEQAKEQIGRELTDEERYNIWFTNNYATGMERFFDPNNLPDYDDPYYNPTPKRTREPYPLPSLKINSGNENWHLLTIDEIINTLDSDITFKTENYQSHPSIKAPLSN